MAALALVHRRLFQNFTDKTFLQFTASIGGWLWLFLTPIVHIVIYSFVFSYIFQVRAPEEFGQTRFVVFMMTGYRLVRVRRGGQQIHQPAAGEGATDNESNVSGRCCR